MYFLEKISLLHLLSPLVWILVPLADAHKWRVFSTFLFIVNNNTIYLSSSSSSFTRSHSITLFLIISTSFSLQWLFDQTIITGIFIFLFSFLFLGFDYFTLLWMFVFIDGVFKVSIFICIFVSLSFQHFLFILMFDLFLFLGFGVFYPFMSVFIDGLFKVSIFFFNITFYFLFKGGVWFVCVVGRSVCCF